MTDFTKVGTYRTRDGKKVIITHIEDGAAIKYPVRGNYDGGISLQGWARDGRFYAEGESEHDLIGPWEEAAPKKPKFEVGQYYRQGSTVWGNGVVRITSIEGRRAHYEIIEGLKKDAGGRSFSFESGFAESLIHLPDYGAVPLAPGSTTTFTVTISPDVVLTDWTRPAPLDKKLLLTEAA